MGHVLVVDDSPTDVQVMREALERGGYQVSDVASGEAALQQVLVMTPDLVLMDVVMPGMNGFQAMRKIVKDPKTRGIPVVIVSVKSMESDRQWGLMQGARDYLVKPFSDELLLSTVARVINGKGP